MKRSSLISVSVCLVSCLFTAIPRASAQQGIVGTVSDSERGTAIRGIQITVLDATNAMLAANVLSGAGGDFNSGNIPAGAYKVRFSDTLSRPGFYPSRFYEVGSDDFCDSQITVVSVLPTTTTMIQVSMRLSGPVQVATFDGVFSGTAFDGATRAPLQGIQVIVLQADSAEVVASTVTDAAGRYRLEPRGLPNSVRLRFFDPTGTFFPEFGGASDSTRDHFCLAPALSLGIKTEYTVDAFLDRVPPEENTQNLLDAIQALDIPPNVETALSSPLIRAVEMLTDANPNNDAGVCGQLTSFISRVGIQERNGQLSPTEANALRQSATNIQTALGCN